MCYCLWSPNAIIKLLSDGTVCIKSLKGKVRLLRIRSFLHLKKRMVFDRLIFRARFQAAENVYKLYKIMLTSQNTLSLVKFATDILPIFAKQTNVLKSDMFCMLKKLYGIRPYSLLEQPVCGTLLPKR